MVKGATVIREYGVHYKVFDNACVGGLCPDNANLDSRPKGH